jgi:hypothetical protein
MMLPDTGLAFSGKRARAREPEFGWSLFSQWAIRVANGSGRWGLRESEARRGDRGAPHTDGYPRRRGRGVATVRRFIALLLSVTLFATATGALAQDAQSAQDAQKMRDKASCADRLRPLETAIESDGKYARAWRDAWLVTGTGLIALNLAGAFTVSGYRRTEGIVIAVQSALLMIQLPVAVSTTQGLRGAASDDPCLALLDARDILVANAADATDHTNVMAHVIAIAIPIITSAILAGATGHWDFATNGNEGLTTLVGIGVGELQVLTYPRPSVKMAGTSLSVTF